MAALTATEAHRARLIEAGAARFRGNSELARKAANTRIARDYARLGLLTDEIPAYQALMKRGFLSAEAARILICSRRPTITPPDCAS